MRLSVLVIPFIVGMGSLVAQGQRDTGPLPPSSIAVRALEPKGWEIAGPGVGPAPVVLRSLPAELITRFDLLYRRDGRLVALGTIGGGVAGLVWDLTASCQVSAFVGLSMSPSTDARFVAFERMVGRGSPPNGTVYQVLDTSAGACESGDGTVPGEGHLEWDAAVNAGHVVMPDGANARRPVSTIESRSPMVWFHHLLIAVSRDSRSGRMLLWTWDASSRHVASREVDPTGIEGPPTDDGALPGASLAFSKISIVGDEDAPRIRLRVSQDYRHRAKWIDVDFPRPGGAR